MCVCVKAAVVGRTTTGSEDHSPGSVATWAQSYTSSTLHAVRNLGFRSARVHLCIAPSVQCIALQEAGSCGFCIFNSICIGALHALHEHHDR